MLMVLGTLETALQLPQILPSHTIFFAFPKVVDHLLEECLEVSGFALSQFLEEVFEEGEEGVELHCVGGQEEQLPPLSLEPPTYHLHIPVSQCVDGKDSASRPSLLFHCPHEPSNGLFQLDRGVVTETSVPQQFSSA